LPSVSVTPAAYAIDWGAAATQPARETGGAMILVFTGGTVSAGPSSNLSDSITTPKLDRIMRQEKIIETGGTASGRFQLIWQRTMEAIESAFTGQQGQITDLSTIVARLEAAEAKADVAVAQSAATAAEDAITKSFPSPSTILSAASDGTITISAHTRVYGDGTSVAVNAGSTSGWAQGQFVQIYYDDAGRAGGAVSYQGTTDLIAQTGARHIIGGVAIPVAGLPAQDGFPPFPPGYVPDYREYGI
jgi:hypothetical protein